MLENFGKGKEVVLTQEGAVAVPEGKGEEFINTNKEDRETWIKDNPTPTSLEQANTDTVKELEPKVAQINSLFDELDKEIENYDPTDQLKRKIMDQKFVNLQSKIRGLSFNPKISPFVSEKLGLKEIENKYNDVLDKKYSKESMNQ